MTTDVTGITFTNTSHVPQRYGSPISPGAYFIVENLTPFGPVVRFNDGGTAEIAYRDWFDADLETIHVCDRVGLTPAGADLAAALP